MRTMCGARAQGEGREQTSRLPKDQGGRRQHNQPTMFHKKSKAFMASGVESVNRVEACIYSQYLRLEMV